MENQNDVGKRPECIPEPGLRLSIAVTAAIGALVAVTLWGEFQSDTGSRLLALDCAVALVSLALTPLTLRQPLACGIVLGVLAALSPVATPAASFAALYTARWRRFPLALAVGGTGLAAQAIQGWWRPAGGLAYPWWLLLMTVGYAALLGWGALAQERAALLASLRDRALRAEAEQGRRVAEARLGERTRIAREMHDVLAHRLSLLATYAGALEYRPDSSPEQLSRAAGVVRDGVHQALDELRQVILVLREDEGADGRPQPVLADIPCLVDESRAVGTAVLLTDRIGAGGELPATIGRTAYRVVQEGLTNARKHAAGSPVAVLLDGRPGLRLTIEISNPMPAKPYPATVVGAGTGLVGLTERVRLAGGELDHQVTAGEFRLAARLPWPA